MMMTMMMAVGDGADPVGWRGDRRAGVPWRTLLHQGVRRAILGPRRRPGAATQRRHHVHRRDEVQNLHNLQTGRALSRAGL